MNPPNGKWRVEKANPASQFDALYWDGSQYVDIANITLANQYLFANNPDYQAAVNLGTIETDVDNIEMQGGELSTVDVVANKVKKLLSKETYQTPKARRNTTFIIITLAAAVLGYMIYKGNIKI